MSLNSLKNSSYLLALLLLPLLSAAASPRQSFEEGNAAYAAGQYTAALKAYGKILAAGDTTAAVCYNMGNASYRNGDLPQAIWYYEKAARLQPGDQSIARNIRVAAAKIKGQPGQLPEFFLDSWINRLTFSLTVRGFAIWSVLLTLTASASLILYFFALRLSVKKPAFYTAIALFICALMTLVLGIRRQNYFTARPEAILSGAESTLRKDADEKSAPLGVLPAGLKVRLLEQRSGCLKVRLTDGNEGWITDTGVKRL